MHAATKTGLYAQKTPSKKLVHKAAGATGEFIGNKIVDKIVKRKPVPDVNSRNAEEIAVPLRSDLCDYSDAYILL